METHSIHYTPTHGWSSVFPAVNSPQTLVLIFGPADWQAYADALMGLKNYYSQAILIGCSGHGSIAEGNLSDEALVVSITRFHTTQLRLSTYQLNQTSDSFIAGQSLAKNLDDPQLKAILVLSDGLKTNGTALSEGLNQHLQQPVTIAGGLSADSLKFKSTWVIANQLPQSDLVCGLGLYGESIHCHSLARDGWNTFGPERLVTSATGNQLYSLDGRPALELYKHYLGERASELPGASLHFPLAIRYPGRPHRVIRTTLGIDEASQSLMFAGDIPEGSTAQLVRGSTHNLLDGAYTASQYLANITQAPPIQTMLLLTISCAARRLVMLEDTELELAAACSAFPKNIKQIGYYSFGELSPRNLALEIAPSSDIFTSQNATSGISKPTASLCELHNQTITLTAIYEQSASWTPEAF